MAVVRAPLLLAPLVVVVARAPFVAPKRVLEVLVTVEVAPRVRARPARAAAPHAPFAIPVTMPMTARDGRIVAEGVLQIAVPVEVAVGPAGAVGPGPQEPLALGDAAPPVQLSLGEQGPQRLGGSGSIYM